jgi:hypothetical protein
MKNRIILTLAVVLGIFCACQKNDQKTDPEEEKDNTYTEYILFYDKNIDSTIVTARLRFGSSTGGEITELGPNASVQFNGEVLTYSQIQYGHTKTYAGKISSGTFTYTNKYGEVFNNDTPAMDTMAHPSNLDTIVKSQPFIYTWIGKPINDNEIIYMRIYNQPGYLGLSGEISVAAYTTGDLGIEIGNTILQLLTEGTSTLHGFRLNEEEVNEGTEAGGVIKTMFRPTNIDIEVVP